MLDCAHIAASRLRAMFERGHARTVPVGVVGALQVCERLPGLAVFRSFDHNACGRVEVGGVLAERGVLAHKDGNRRGCARNRLNGAKVGGQHYAGGIGGVRGKSRRQRDRLRVERIEYLADDWIGRIVGRQPVQLERGGTILAKVRARRDQEDGRAGGLCRNGGAHSVNGAANHHHVRLAQGRRDGGKSRARHHHDNSSAITKPALRLHRI